MLIMGVGEFLQNVEQRAGKPLDTTRAHNVTRGPAFSRVRITELIH
jgi:hypothetical protein